MCGFVIAWIRYIVPYMVRLKAILLAFALLPAVVPGQENPRVEVVTIVLELFADKAPKSVRNFLDYLAYQYYDDMIFHRVIDDWVIQTGNYDADLVGYETDPPVRSEATNGLKNLRGTVAMARGADPHSATSQWFINLRDNPELDHQSRAPQLYGYAVFGRVAQGMEVADAIGDVPTHNHAGFENLPVEPVVIVSARVREP